MENKKPTFWQSELIRSSIKGSFRRLDPRTLWHNPVMFVVEIVSVITTVISVNNLINGGPFWFNIHISVWLWFTVLFANFAEALAEGRGKAQAETLRRAQSEAYAKDSSPTESPKTSLPSLCGKTILSSLKMVIRYRATAKSSKAWPLSTNRL